MYKVITTFERPNEDVPYYLETVPDLRNRFVKFISDSDELLLVNSLDETLTKQVTEAFFADEDAFNEFIRKFNIEFPNFFADRDTYHASVGITTTRTVADF